MIPIFSQERKNKILQILEEEGSVSVIHLAEKLCASKETIRRDLTALEKEGKLQRSHGGAVPLSSSAPVVPAAGAFYHTTTNADHPFAARYPQNLSAKKKLAKKAASFIQSRDTIFIDNSSTTLLLLDYIPKDIQFTIITNSIQVLLRAASIGNPNLSLICLGGFYNAANYSLYGSRTLQSMAEFYPDKAFISCTGISLFRQLTDICIDEVDTKRTIIQKAQQTYLLADHTKFGNDGPFHFSEFQNIDSIITDAYDHTPENLEIIHTIHTKYNVQIITSDSDL